ncbi:MAG: hypothetical protein RL562_3240 [Planctomycetota bacterium]
MQPMRALALITLALTATLGGTVTAQSFVEPRARLPVASGDAALAVAPFGPGRLLVATAQDLIVYDTTPLPASGPLEVGRLVGGGGTHLSADAAQGLACVTPMPAAGSHGTVGVVLLRITQDQPSLAATWSETGLVAAGTSFGGQHVFVAGHRAGLRILDVTDPSQPILAASLGSPLIDAHAVAVRGVRGYVADGSGGLKTLNLTDPTRPAVNGAETPATALGAALDVALSTHPIHGDLVHIATGTPGIATYAAGSRSGLLALRVLGTTVALASLGARILHASIDGAGVAEHAAGPFLVPVGSDRRAGATADVCVRVAGFDGSFMAAACGAGGVAIYEIVDAAAATLPDVDCDQDVLRFAPPLDVVGLRLRNLGAAPLSVQGITSSRSDFVPSWTSGVLAPGETRALEVTHGPGTPTGTGLLRITTDDPDEAILEIPIVASTPGPDVGEPAPPVVVEGFAPDPITGALVAQGPLDPQGLQGRAVLVRRAPVGAARSWRSHADHARSVVRAFDDHPGVVTGLVEDGTNTAEPDYVADWSARQSPGRGPRPALWLDRTGTTSTSYELPALPGRDDAVVVGPDGRIAAVFDRVRPRDVLLELASLAPRAPGPIDPDPPAGGFAVIDELAMEIVYFDGYRTRCDVRYPDPQQAPPPPGGWPVLLMPHPLRSSRTPNARSGRERAAEGYLTIVYDVRGHGDTPQLNTTGGASLVGPAERADMAEILWAVHDRFPQLFDLGRIGVAGLSQGALHARAAAAWSGRLLPEPRGSVTRFPVIRAVVCDSALGTDEELLGREAKVFAPLGIDPFVFPNGLVPDPDAATAVLQAFVQQDFAAWAAFQTSRDRGERALLAHSSVPILAHTSWHDDYLSPTSLIDLLATLPIDTPRSILIETGDHRSPSNFITRALRTERELRWLARFLKGDDDELPEQQTFHLGVVPDDIGGYLGGLTVWPFRQADDWPQRGVTVRDTLHLRTGAVLVASPPIGSEPADTVQHQVATGFDPHAWIATANDTQAVFASIPLSQALYRTAPLSADREIHGRPSADLWIDSQAPHLQLGFALLDEAPNGTTRYLTGGQLALRDRTPGAEAVRIELGGCATTIRAGHRVVLAIENHVWHRPPNQSLLRTAPYFESYSVDVLHTDLRPSTLELPFLPRPGFSIRAANTRVSASQGSTTYLELRGHASRAGAPYAVLMSLSGTTPGTTVLGQHVPINFDAMTQAVIAGAGPPALPSFVGTLGIDGRANAYFVARPGLIPPSLAGTEMAFSAVTLTAEGVVPATSTDVRIMP